MSAAGHARLLAWSVTAGRSTSVRVGSLTPNSNLEGERADGSVSYRDPIPTAPGQTSSQ
jgi:hypothetical protein